MKISWPRSTQNLAPRGFFSNRTADRPVQSSGANSQEVRHLNFFFSTPSAPGCMMRTRIAAKLVECAAYRPLNINHAQIFARMALVVLRLGIRDDCISHRGRR
jgi:hypothetical protein